MKTIIVTLQNEVMKFDVKDNAVVIINRNKVAIEEDGINALDGHGLHEHNTHQQISYKEIENEMFAVVMYDKVEII